MTPAVFIWGMGLMGASLALRLKNHGYRIQGAVRSAASRTALMELGFTDVFTEEASIIQAMHDTDILVLGLNLSDCYPALTLILSNPELRKKLIIFDMCSTKQEICDWVAKHYPDARFIGAHPMAGKEKQGPNAAEATLFEGSTVFLTPLKDQKAEKQKVLLQAAEKIWQLAGAKTLIMNPEEHDNRMAYVSHGLHLAACLIARLSVTGIKPEGTAVAGSYRDMTRIVQSSPVMWSDIIRSNKENTAHWLKELARECNSLADGLTNGSADIGQLFTEAAAARRQIMQT